VTIFAKTLFALVRCHFMTFAFTTTGHKNSFNFLKSETSFI